MCGSFAGVANVISGYPLDSVKVRMQTANLNSKLSMRAVITDTISNEGVLAFYKGMGPPLVTVPLINSIIFASYEFYKKLINVESEADFTFNQCMQAGMFAGFINSFVLSPIELVKCRLQIQTEANLQNAYYKGSLHCIRRIVSEEGINGLFKGLVATILREVPCYAG